MNFTCPWCLQEVQVEVDSQWDIDCALFSCPVCQKEFSTHEGVEVEVYGPND